MTPLLKLKMWGFFRRWVSGDCGLIRTHKNERKTGLGVSLSYLMAVRCDFWVGGGLGQGWGLLSRVSLLSPGCWIPWVPLNILWKGYILRVFTVPVHKLLCFVEFHFGMVIDVCYQWGFILKELPIFLCLHGQKCLNSFLSNQSKAELEIFRIKFKPRCSQCWWIFKKWKGQVW